MSLKTHTVIIQYRPLLYEPVHNNNQVALRQINSGNVKLGRQWLLNAQWE